MILPRPFRFTIVKMDYAYFYRQLKTILHRGRRLTVRNVAFSVGNIPLHGKPQRRSERMNQVRIIAPIDAVLIQSGKTMIAYTPIP